MKRSDLSRREFLEISAAAGAAALLSNAPRPSFSSPDRLSASPRPVPAERPRALRHDRRWACKAPVCWRSRSNCPASNALPPADLYDGRHTLAREITAKPNLPVTRRYQELLDNKEIDCIVAAVPDHWHKQVVVDAVNAGKDIYCEKPMSHSPADGVDMVDADEENRAHRADRLAARQFGDLRQSQGNDRAGRDRRPDAGRRLRWAATIPPALGISAASRSFAAEPRLGHLAGNGSQARL